VLRAATVGRERMERGHALESGPFRIQPGGPRREAVCFLARAGFDGSRGALPAQPLRPVGTCGARVLPPGYAVPLGR
jgi:hypothetical protein